LLRFSAPLVIVIALLGAAPASAGLAPNLYTGQTRPGVQTSSRAATGSCSTSVSLPSDLVLRCDDSSGSARAKFIFTLPKKAGSVTSQVSYVGSHGGARVSAKRTSDTQFRVIVTRDSAGRAEIASVTIEYYVG
jgi:hypothetical protein